VRRAIAATMAATTVSLAVATAGVASANPVEPQPGPPFIDHTEWVHWADLSSLRVFPTPSGRAAAGEIGTNADGAEAWTEVLALSPDADLPGMRAQFICHWQIAEFAEPGKASWNLEPFRPEVNDNQMLASGCNPGGIEEPF
jgi:hypothetical protein